MTRNVSGELPPGSVPTAITLCLRLETGALPKKRQHAFGLKLEQVRGVEILRLLQRTARQAHAAQRQRDSLELDLFRIGRGMRQRDRWQKKAKNNKYRNTEFLHATSTSPNEYKIV